MKIRCLNPPRTPWAISACCGRPLPFTESLIHIITDKDNPELRASVEDLGFYDHLAQIVRINIGKGNRRTKIAVRRQLIWLLCN
jgi:hypothetical protein